MTTPAVGCQDEGDYNATGVRKVKTIRGRTKLPIATWDPRTLRPAVKLRKLTNEMDRHHWKKTGALWDFLGELL